MLRFGVLGAARVVSYGLIGPARETTEIEIAAVASRSLARAQAFAKEHAIARAYGSYEDLLADPAIDAVYVALPTALHETWATRALDAKKHVLCEKPLATSAVAAKRMAAASAKNDRVLMEAMHTVHARGLRALRDRVLSGELGELEALDSCFRFPLIPMAKDDFRLSAELGGGALLDLGCYAISCAMLLIDAIDQAPQVVSAEAKFMSPLVDRWMRAELRFPSGARALIECGFLGMFTPRFEVVAKGARGSATWKKSELDTHALQLRAFARAIAGERDPLLSLERSIAAAEVLDAIRQNAK